MKSEKFEDVQEGMQEVRRYVSAHLEIQKELIDFGILVLRVKMSQKNETIEQLRAMNFDYIY